MTARRAVVTGATGGIGEAAARRLAQAGFAVTLVGRDRDRAGAALARVAAAVPGADLGAEAADLAEPGEVRDLSGRLAAVGRITVLVNNAGVVCPLNWVNSAGVPVVVAVNHLAPHLLTRLLLPALVGGRVVVVGTDPALLAPEEVDPLDIALRNRGTLGADPALHPYRAYLRTKASCAMTAVALAGQVAGRTTVNICHPGMVEGTRLGHGTPGLATAILAGYREGSLTPPGPQPDTYGLRGPDAGADGLVWVATAAELDAVTGAYFAGRVPVDSPGHLTDPARCARVWTACSHLVGLDS